MTMRERYASTSKTLGLAPFRDPAGDRPTRSALPPRHRRMVGPVVLIDQIGPADFGPGRGLGRVAHPHVGVETLTYLVDGEITHRDNLGTVQTTRPGEITRMTAGAGIVHSERTPPHVQASGGNLFGFQAWLALPRRYEDVAPGLAHYAASQIPRICAGGVEFTLVAGESDGLRSPVDTFSDMVLAAIVLTSGACYQVRPLHRERAVYLSAGEVEIVGRAGVLRAGEWVFLEPGTEVVFAAPAFHSARLVLVGGEPLSEARHVCWNFVSSSLDRIEQARSDWRHRRFPSVPGEKDVALLPEG